MIRIQAYILQLVAIYLLFVFATNAYAVSRFRSDYPCSDTGKYCVSSGTRTVQGFQVHRDCWEWAYTKSCNYPSKNDCVRHAKCYSLGQRDCLLRDSMGNCINLKKEFSCKRWTPTYVESETVRYGFEDKEGQKGLVCSSIPCIDGNCVDKSYEMDTDMVASVSNLNAVAKGRRGKTGVTLFEGLGNHCSKKIADYSNCCQVYPKGWGKKLGAKCTSGEIKLSEDRQKNLCVYVGRDTIKKLGVPVVKKHHFCCFNNLIEKTIQVQARRQPLIRRNFRGSNGFGSGGNPDCRGLTLKELSKVDFSKIDFSEVAAEMHKKIAMPDIKDVESRIKDSFKNTTKFDHDKPAHSGNKAAGINQKVMENQK